MSFPGDGTDIVPSKTVRSLILVSTLGTGVTLAAEVNPYLDLDFHTLQTARAAVQRALESRATGDRETWSVSGVARGAVTPRRTWRSKSGHWCREFEEIVWLANGRTGTALGTRCRDANGKWLHAN